MPVVDVGFRILGKSIPADHGYALYGAIARIAENGGRKVLHEPPTESWKRAAILPINGRAIGDRKLMLSPTSRLMIRLDSELIKDILPLAGKTLDLDGSIVRVGVPTIYSLKPAARLRSRLVVIKGMMEAEPFLQSVRYALEKLNVKGTPGLLKRQLNKALEGKTGAEPKHSPFIRRTIRIHDKEVVGYAVEVQDLTADESLTLQEHGIGGRRKFGCGVFVPARG
jgi:CRISPR-associated protein Cas6